MSNTVHNSDSNDSKNLLEVDNLKVHFSIESKGIFSIKKEICYAVDGISFSVKQGEIFGLVGESGCGKSTTARTIVRLNNPSDGNIIFEGKDIAHANGKDLISLRCDIQMIFQDPYASLNPRMTVGSIVSEPLHILRNNKILDITKIEIEKRVDTLLEQVGLNRSMKKRFPHEFSGGQRQRIGIARSIATYPKLIIADEPISALDVSIQAQILNLMKSLQKELGLTYVFIAHDLTVVNYLCDRIGVMYLGNLVEMADSDSLNQNPLHPYTKMLLDAVLIPNPRQKDEKTHELVVGEVEQNVNRMGCPFYHRCSFRMDKCKSNKPELKETKSNHKVACFLY